LPISPQRSNACDLGMPPGPDQIAQLPFLSQRRKDAKGRDPRKISPFGRNDTERYLALWRDCWRSAQLGNSRFNVGGFELS
jgi:hypothetical protein